MSTLTDQNFDRIWLEPREGADPYIGRQWCQDNQWGEDGIEYVRADVIGNEYPHWHSARIEQLERELASARSYAEQINREAFMVFIRKWAKSRFGKWITYNTAKGAYSQFCEERAAIRRLAEQEGT